MNGLVEFRAPLLSSGSLVFLTPFTERERISTSGNFFV